MSLLEIAIAISSWMLSLFILSFLMFLICSGYLIYRLKRGQFNYKQLSLVVVTAIFTLLIYASDKFIVGSILDKTELLLNNSSTVILVDGVKTNLHQKLSAAFRERYYLKQSGSRPTKYVSILLESPNFSVQYLLRQDSREKNLYWVYIPEMKRRSTVCYIKIYL